MSRTGLWVPLALALLALQVSAQRTVRFDSSGKLKLVQLTDMHVGEGRERDAQTRQVGSAHSSPTGQWLSSLEHQSHMIQFFPSGRASAGAENRLWHHTTLKMGETTA